MSKKISIIISIILILISLVPMKSNAVVSIDTATIYSKRVTDYLLVKDGIKVHTYIAMYSVNGTEYPAYCMNKDLPGVETGSQTVNISNLVSNVMVWRVLINGYPYKTISELGCQTEDEAYLATKQAVYCVLAGTDVSAYSAIDGSQASQRTLNALQKILSAAYSSSATKVSSELTIEQENSLWQIDSLDSNYVSQTFSVTANASFSSYTVGLNGLDIEGAKLVNEDNNETTEFKSGEKFKILIPVTNIMHDGNFIINVSSEVETKPVLYGVSSVSGMQNYAMTGYTYEDGMGTEKVYYTKNETKIIITKTNETGEINLQGVEFDLLDENQEVLYTELTTDENGQIEIDNLLPGVYYIRETRTIEGYELYNQLIKVELDLNETANVNVMNQEEAQEVQKDESQTEITVKSTSSQTEVVNEVTEVKLPKTGM